MTTRSFKIESGHEYSLSQIFNGDYKIVIPDLQRDYCWGDKAWNKDTNNYRELVSNFVKNLITTFKEKEDNQLTLGLIYGYENPHFTIQLCDGQQRLTTLFLLIGLLYRRTKSEELKGLLMTDFEIKDDKEPNLQYAIRESTLYFLSDLVFDFFIEGNGDIDSIKKSDWYFAEYNLDASIQSIIKAIKLIDELLISSSKDNNVNLEDFADFIINQLSILYYDMGDRTRGEETFVIINTTGEPLTATENLKPILLGNIENSKKREDFSAQWEEREDWFWQMKNKNEPTSDEALKDFFIWYWQIRLLQEKAYRGKTPYPLNPIELFQSKPKVNEEDEEKPELTKWEESVNLETVHKYFLALKEVVRKSKENNNAQVLKSIHGGNEISLSWFRRNKEQLDVILPLLAYAVKFEKLENFHLFVRRIRKNYFDYDNIWKRKHDNEWERKQNYIDWRHIIQIIEFSETEDEVLKYDTILNENRFKNIANVALNEWYNEEEKLKDRLSSHSSEIQKWEDHKDFMGDISFLMEVHKHNGEEEPSFKDLRNYYTNYVEVIDSIRYDIEDIKTNTYRLFLLYAGHEKPEHKPRVAREIKGVLFSTIRKRSFYNKHLQSLCSKPSESILKHCLSVIGAEIKKQDILNIDKDNFSVDKALKFWLTLKVFYANSQNKCLSNWDGNNNDEGVSVYKDMNKNRLIDTEDFSYYNMICGFGVKSGRYGSGVRYTNKGLWNKVHIIDTPFGAVSFSKEERTPEGLLAHKEIIDKIIKDIEEQID